MLLALDEDTPRILSSFPTVRRYPFTPLDREGHSKVKCLAQEYYTKTRPGLEPRLLTPESSMLIVSKPRLHYTVTRTKETFVIVSTTRPDVEYQIKFYTLRTAASDENLTTTVVLGRSEERPEGKKCVSKSRSGW